MKICCACRDIIRIILLIMSFFAPAAPGQAMDSWTYRQEWDKLNNLNYSLARSPLPKRGLYDNLRLEVVCKDNHLQLVLDANSLLTSKGSKFDLEYQIDNNPSVTIPMHTYGNSKRRGYTDQQVERIVTEILAGKSIFIRIETLIRTVLSSLIPLTGAAKPIHQVLADCGVEIPDANKLPPDYGLVDFERDLKTLTPQQQREVLDKVKTIMTPFR